MREDCEVHPAREKAADRCVRDGKSLALALGDPGAGGSCSWSGEVRCVRAECCLRTSWDQPCFSGSSSPSPSHCLPGGREWGQGGPHCPQTPARGEEPCTAEVGVASWQSRSLCARVLRSSTAPLHVLFTPHRVSGGCTQGAQVQMRTEGRSLPPPQNSRPAAPKTI